MVPKPSYPSPPEAAERSSWYRSWKDEAMPEPLTIRLPDDLSRALDMAAEQMHRERAEIIRLALYHYLGISSEGYEAPAERVRHLLGSLDSGIPDLAENHRTYLLDSLTQKHGR